MMLTKFAQDSAFPDVGISKLEIMQAYSEAQICRRVMLLNYFSEQLSVPCGNCDVCKNPPQKVEGTQLAQMALSAIVRMEESGGLTQVIQVLRGNNLAEIREKGWSQLKTFGVGRHVSQWLWGRYLMQMQQLGLIEIAYEQSFALKVTPSGWAVLKGQQQVQFFEPKIAEKPAEIEFPQASEPKSRNPTLRTQIKDKRMELAKAQGVPPYVIFNDKTLEAILDKMPVTLDDWLQVEGISTYRAGQYMPHFTPLIDAHLKANKPLPVPKGTATHEVTWRLFEEGLNLEEIATQRKLASGTITQHLAKCMQEGLPVPVPKIVGEASLQRILDAVVALQQKTQLRLLFEYLEEQVSYDHLRLGLTYWEQMGALIDIPGQAVVPAKE
jgi:ATP-dependent DNA helicase RecQ